MLHNCGTALLQKIHSMDIDMQLKLIADTSYISPNCAILHSKREVTLTCGDERVSY